MFYVIDLKLEMNFNAQHIANLASILKTIIPLLPMFNLFVTL